jgi:Sec-independent protein translocase protein TatA
MSISFGEILVIFFVGILFFKPEEIKAFISSFFSMKQNLEKEVNGVVKHFTEEEDIKHCVEFFEVESKCQKQQ